MDLCAKTITIWLDKILPYFVSMPILWDADVTQNRASGDITTHNCRLAGRTNGNKIIFALEYLLGQFKVMAMPQH